MADSEAARGAQPTDDRLRLLIERIERLEEEKKGIADDVRDVYAEAKAVGYDPKIMRQIVRLRKMRQSSTPTRPRSAWGEAARPEALPQAKLDEGPRVRDE